MKTNRVFIPITLSAALLAFPITIAGLARANEMSEPTPLVALGNKGELLREGRFDSLEKRTKGNVRLVRGDNGRLYIDFDRNFRTESGSDVFVILARSADLKNDPGNSALYYTVSPLLRREGEQRYILPGDFTPDDYASVAIWSRQDKLLFGAATLK